MTARAIEVMALRGLGYTVDDIANTLGISANTVRVYLYNTYQKGDDLTTTQLKVAKLIAAGKTKKEVANDLEMALQTVNTHVAHIYQKLGIDKATKILTAITERGVR